MLGSDSPFAVLKEAPGYVFCLAWLSQSHFPLLPAKNLTHVSGFTFRAFCSSATGRNVSGLDWGCRGEHK